MTVTAAQVKELREKTGAGMLDAKNALVEAGGDMEKAGEILRQKGIATAEKKSGRTAAEGLVQAALSGNKKAGVLLEVNCETDFVAKGEAFQAMVKEVAEHVLSAAPSDVDTLLGQSLGGASVKDYVAEKIGQIKENLSVRRFVRYEVKGAGLVNSYIHTGGKIGVLLELNAEKDASLSSPEIQQLAKDLSMQIASAAPEYVGRHEIPQDVIDDETRVEMGKEDIQNKPVDIREKIVKGRVDKLLGQRILLEQPFVKDPGKTIEALIDEKSKALGDKLSVPRFTRYVLGEGIEKKESNFAEEVMAQLK